MLSVTEPVSAQHGFRYHFVSYPTMPCFFLVVGFSLVSGSSLRRQN